MPRNLSAWIDLTIQLACMLILVGVLYYYNGYIAGISLVVWLCLASFARERVKDRKRRFERYCRNVIKNINEMTDYAVEELPQGIAVVDEDGRVQWSNKNLAVLIHKLLGLLLQHRVLQHSHGVLGLLGQKLRVPQRVLHIKDFFRSHLFITSSVVSAPRAEIMRCFLIEQNFL